MKFYRVEHENSGIGWFQHYSDEWRLSREYTLLTDLHKPMPTPIEDFPMMPRHGYFKEYYTSHSFLACAYPSIQELILYSTTEIRKKAIKLGFRFYEVETEWCDNSIHQVIFWQNAPDLVKTDITDRIVTYNQKEN